MHAPKKFVTSSNKLVWPIWENTNFSVLPRKACRITFASEIKINES